ncbi:MAG: hypothetical protein ACOYNN_18145, partial [Terrimicrobiaceae bacterium]
TLRFQIESRIAFDGLFDVDGYVIDSIDSKDDDKLRILHDGTCFCYFCSITDKTVILSVVMIELTSEDLDENALIESSANLNNAFLELLVTSEDVHVEVLYLEYIGTED